MRHVNRSWAGGWLLGMAGASLITLPVHGQQLFSESFDTLPLGPNVEEASVGLQVWTKTPPSGWSIDDSGMPGFGQPDYADRDGRREWAGWSFADVKWWPTVDNQRRAEFTLASGAAAIADPDEWDDAAHYPGLFNSYLSTPEIPVAGKAANSLVIFFDSSWRPEFSDDGLPSFPVDPVTGDQLNNQTAVIKASWDGGPEVEVLRWDSNPESPTFKADGEFINEAAMVELKNPAGAQKLKLRIGMIEAANDWWWAFDNLAVGEPPMLAGASATGVAINARLREALGKTVNDSAPITAKLDGQTVAITTSRDGETVFVVHNQSPRIFVPRSVHTLEVSFRSGDGRQINDRATFVAPGYSAVSSTPTLMTATISETDYLAVDESKGIRLELNGTPVTATSVTRQDLTAADGSDAPDRIVVTYAFPTVPPSASTHALKLGFTTKTAQLVEETLGFKLPAYADLPPALATAIGTGADAGIRWRTHQLPAARPANNAENVEKQLRGELGASVHDTNGQDAQGYFSVDYVNLDQAAGEQGNFKGSATVNELIVADSLIPGIPGTTGLTDFIATEALTYVEIPTAGVYTMSVVSDDGFSLSMGNAANPTFLPLAQRTGTTSTFYFRATQPGVYLFRLIYWENGGNAYVEWYTTNAAGQPALVNGPDTGVTPLKAFKRRTVAEPSLPVTTPTIGVSAQAGKVVLTYTGTLLGADSVKGPFTPVAGAASPYSVTPTGEGKFYRAQQ